MSVRTVLVGSTDPLVTP